ncbi:MAG: hypothetical protein ACTSYM_01710 [Candidatus Baldrarchaeia archaeon]
MLFDERGEVIKTVRLDITRRREYIMNILRRERRFRKNLLRNR